MKFLYACFLMLVPFRAVCQSDTIHYKIYSLKERKLVSVNDIVSAMANNDVLFFGEEHNDSTGHIIEYALLKRLSEKYKGKTALSMEMFETDCQTVVNEYLAGLIREKNFTSEARAWPNYADYRPLIELSKANDIHVIGANAPGRYTNMANRLGLISLLQLDKTAKTWLPPLPIDTATGTYYNKFAQIMGGHAAMPGMQMYQAQSLWDATMGWSIARFYKKHRDYKILQLNGGFHSDEKLGAAWQLKKYAPKARILNIAFQSGREFNHPDWGRYSTANDYIILTPPGLSKTF